MLNIDSYYTVTVLGVDVMRSQAKYVAPRRAATQNQRVTGRITGSFFRGFSDENSHRSLVTRSLLI